MKKAITLLLALAVCLSLCACGGSNDTPTTEAHAEKTMDKNDASNYVGEWTNGSAILTITKGGVGRYTFLRDGYEEPYELNWEVKDGVLVTQISLFGMEHKAVLELNEDGTVLNAIKMGFPIYVNDETAFTKK